MMIEKFTRLFGYVSFRVGMNKRAKAKINGLKIRFPSKESAQIHSELAAYVEAQREKAARKKAEKEKAARIKAGLETAQPMTPEQRHEYFTNAYNRAGHW